MARYLHFPDANTLQLAVTSGVVPVEAVRESAKAGFDDRGGVWVRTEARFPRKSLAELSALSVENRRSAGVPLDVDVDSWTELFPLSPAAGPLEVDDRTPVLFELRKDGLLSALVNEMLRLNNDRQSFRRFQNNGDAHTLLKVIGPPYYSLLRALDSGDDASAPVAYFEQAPQVWVEAGWVHPAADLLNPPAGRFLMIRPPRRWRLVKEAPFRDVYERLEFSLPDAKMAYEDVGLDQPIKVPVRLTPGGPAETPQLWVLSDRGVEQLEDLVHASDDRVLSRLAFAVATTDAGDVVVLRTRPGKDAPPVLVVDGLACRSHLKLPNLFAPVGRTLHPPLRRDAVKRLLADDPDRIVWLEPTGEDESAGRRSGFTPRSVADSAFRPLSDWVEYILDRESEPLQSWMQSHTFDFDSFVTVDDVPTNASRPERKRKQPAHYDPALTVDRGRAVSQQPDQTGVADDDDLAAESLRASNIEFEPQTPNSELHERLRICEQAFLDSDAPLDAPERRRRWVEMAGLNAALGNIADGRVCRVNALWELDDPIEDEVRAWLSSEQGSGSGDAGSDWLEPATRSETLTPADLNALVAGMILTAREETPSETVVPPEVAGRLASHEAHLPVRASWMAQRALSQLSGGDVLALVRARDRLLERLHERGLSPGLDLPSFFRTAGAADADRAGEVRGLVHRLHAAARSWIETESRRASEADLTVNLAKAKTASYTDLAFAFGLARLGESTAAQELSRTAARSIEGDPLHDWLSAAWRHRIEQALAGRPAHDGLPESLLAAVREDDPEPKDGSSPLDAMTRYQLNRMRRASRVLEPEVPVNPYGRFLKEGGDELGRRLESLGDVHDANELNVRVRALFDSDDATGPLAEARVLSRALAVAPRLGDEVAAGLFARLDAIEVGPLPIDARAELFEHALLAAAHFGRHTELENFVDAYLTLFETSDEASSMELLSTRAGDAVRSLRRLGMRDEVGRFLERLEGCAARAADSAAQPQEVTAAWRLRLCAAAGGYYYGRDDEAGAVVDECFRFLLAEDAATKQSSGDGFRPVFRAGVATALIDALGFAPVEFAGPRLEALFDRLSGVHVTSQTDAHFSVSLLAIVEAAVLALVGDESALNQEARRLRDEDEYLIRRRIHEDVRRALET